MKYTITPQHVGSVMDLRCDALMWRNQNDPGDEVRCTLMAGHTTCHLHASRGYTRICDHTTCQGT